ncbi:MAG TPA: hypothetical protein VIG06_02855 [Kofleriaceae bacterium]|jgi:hypothetical protein
MRKHRARGRRLTAAELAEVQGGGILLPALGQTKERTAAFEPSLDPAFTYQRITWE